MIALLLFEQNAYSKARQYCQKALEVNPNYGNAYLLIGKMYAATSKSVFPNDGVLARAAYNAAIDKFEKAKQVDPSVAEEANTLISSYRAHLFYGGDLHAPGFGEGQTFHCRWLDRRAYNDSVIMIGNRFHCKTENMGITTTFVVVVMLLCFLPLAVRSIRRWLMLSLTRTRLIR